MTTQDTPTPEITLPPIREVDSYTVFSHASDVNSDDISIEEGARLIIAQMQDYARAAIELDRQQRGEPVAYLDIGTGGYLDLGSDKSDDELMALPPGRHPLYMHMTLTQRALIDAINTLGIDSRVNLPDYVLSDAIWAHIHGQKHEPLPAPQPAAPAQPTHKVAGKKIGPDTYEAVDAPAQEPSDEDILRIFADAVGNNEDGTRFIDVEEGQAIDIARALLSRYGAAQPADIYPDDLIATYDKGYQDGMRAAQPAASAELVTTSDYEEVLADHRRLVRELDVLLNGEEGAAKQASLCDIVAQVQREGIKAAQPAVSAQEPIYQARDRRGPGSWTDVSKEHYDHRGNFPEVMERRIVYTVPVAAQPIVTDEMVSRFLGWKLPDDFAPDCGVSFTRLLFPNNQPTGTNLLTVIQARKMLEYVLQGARIAAQPSAHRHPLEIYAESYDLMCRIAEREGREPVVSPHSVAVDIRKNMIPATTAPVTAQPAASADYCTDSDNCRRCQTMPEHRGDMRHAGIGGYPSKPAAPTPPADEPHPPSRHCMCSECAPSFEPAPTADGQDELKAIHAAARHAGWMFTKHADGIVRMEPLITGMAQAADGQTLRKPLYVDALDCRSAHIGGAQETVLYSDRQNPEQAALVPADGQAQQKSESWDLSHPDKSHTMTVYSPWHVEHFKTLGWQLIEQQDHPEANCHKCGGPNIVWFADSTLWNAHAGDHGILCPVCFAQQAEANGFVPTAWVLTPEEQQETCGTCQGNGEIVTDWDRYKHPHDGDKGEEAVAECPDCDGQGKVEPRQQDADKVDALTISDELLHFLHGSGAIDGVWFGDPHPAYKGAFWWRILLPQPRAQQGGQS